MTKERLDKLVVERGLAPSRERARALILAGKVEVDGRVVDKAGALVAGEIRLVEADHPYVSRGALKLVKALDHFGVDPAGKVALDAGASTGGFTDVLLRRGARKVFAVDVGYGQLAWSLRQDPRVVVLERDSVVGIITSLDLVAHWPTRASFAAPDGPRLRRRSAHTEKHPAPKASSPKRK